MPPTLRTGPAPIIYHYFSMVMLWTKPAQKQLRPEIAGAHQWAHGAGPLGRVFAFVGRRSSRSPKIGFVAQTLPEWAKGAEIDSGEREGLITARREPS